MTMKRSLLPRFDLYDPQVVADPYPVYAELRRSGPLARGGPGQYVVPRYADVLPLMTDHRLSGNFSGDYHRLTIGEGPASDFFQRVVLNQDPPLHTRVRRLMGQAITPSTARDLVPRLGEFVDELLEPALDRAGFDAVADLGYPLPLRVLGELLRIEPSDLPEVGRRAMSVAKAFAAFLAPEDRVTTHDSVVWLYGYIGDLLAERRRRPGDDVLSRLLAAEDNGDRLTDTEVIENVVFMLFAGFETTTSLIANGCKALADNPDQLDRLRAEPALVATASEEFLRYEAPIQVKLRLVREPIELAGRMLRPGRVIALLLGSANRDGSQFAEPDRVDIGRTPNQHMSFGGGHHRCIGAAIARAEAAAVFCGLARRFAKLEPAGPAQRQLRPGFRTYDLLPLAAVPA